MVESGENLLGRVLTIGVSDHEHVNHTVAQNLLRPANIFLAQYNGHAGGGSHANQGAECVDDVHEGHRDGQTGDGQCAHPMPDEDTIYNIIDRSDDLADDSGQGILPQ